MLETSTEKRPKIINNDYKTQSQIIKKKTQKRWLNQNKPVEKLGCSYRCILTDMNT